MSRWRAQAVVVATLTWGCADGGEPRTAFAPEALPRPMRFYTGVELAIEDGFTVSLRPASGSAAVAPRDVTAYFVPDGVGVSGELPAHLAPAGRHVAELRIDLGGDGSVDLTRSSAFEIEPGARHHSVARAWNEVLLAAIRRDTPRPTVHARNLFHLSVAMWDCWVAFDDAGATTPYLHHEPTPTALPAASRHACISHAAHRLLAHRFADSISAGEILPDIERAMTAMGYDPAFVPADGFEASPEALGLRVAETVIAYGLVDGANEANDYDDPTYYPINLPLAFRLSGTGVSIFDPNRWSPLSFDHACLQNGIPLPFGEVQSFVGANWDGVTPFALMRTDPARPYLDPGAPPLAVEWEDALGIVGPGDLAFKEQMLEVVRYSAGLDPDTAPVVDLSPGAVGGNSLEGFRAGVFDGTGYPVNPATGRLYAPNLVNEADYGRVVAEFWADGPHSETPPGHWNVLANEIAEHQAFERRVYGDGAVVDALEWDVKLYLALNGALHDAAIAAWGAKRFYDYTRPIAGIRWLAEQGQSSDPGAASYSEHGMLLEPGLSELITAESSAPGERHAHLADHVGEIAFHVWPGEPNRHVPATCDEEPPEPDPELEIPAYSGREWIRAVDWITYQRRTFVTPPFAAYVSGHSTFSRAAAVVLHRMTGSPYFPGGLGEFVAPRNDFLIFETGPTETVRLQWATYYDAADEAGISRLWGGIHVAADDFRGRLMGDEVGHVAFEKARTYWDDEPEP